MAADVKARLCDDLARLPGAVSWLAWLDQQPVGLLNALQGYSSFKARPLMNVHDIAVDPAQRGKGIGQALLKALEEHAQQLGCCKLTLEVLSGNSVAKQSYARFGFEQYTLSALTGQALFMQKWLCPKTTPPPHLNEGQSPPRVRRSHGGSTSRHAPRPHPTHQLFQRHGPALEVDRSYLR